MYIRDIPVHVRLIIRVYMYRVVSSQCSSSRVTVNMLTLVSVLHVMYSMRVLVLCSINTHTMVHTYLLQSHRLPSTVSKQAPHAVSLPIVALRGPCKEKKITPCFLWVLVLKASDKPPFFRAMFFYPIAHWPKS